MTNCEHADFKLEEIFEFGLLGIDPETQEFERFLGSNFCKIPSKEQGTPWNYRGVAFKLCFFIFHPTNFFMEIIQGKCKISSLFIDPLTSVLHHLMENLPKSQNIDFFQNFRR